MYKKHANVISQAIAAAFPGVEFDFVLNPTKPRSKSFEITLIKGGKGMTDEFEFYLTS